MNRPPPVAAYIGLGSNLGDRLSNLRGALGHMQQGGVRVSRISSVYETEPVGPPQPLYLNAVCLAETHLSPGALLVVLKQIEKKLGRVPGQHWGPREIDLDILLYGDQTIETKDLRIPHEQLTRRPFVLLPLLEIAPALELPSGEPLAKFLPDMPAGVRRIQGGDLAGGEVGP